MFKYLKVGTALFTAALICTTDVAAMPGMDAPVTKENILSILNKYDKYGAYFVNDSVSKGRDITEWWESEPGASIADNLDTAVHEEYHAYISNNSNKNDQVICTEGIKKYYVPYTKVFKAKIMGLTIPKELRTTRWDIYVGSKSNDVAANVEAVYGMLNEFSAYNWGMNTDLSLYKYLDDVQASPSDWSNVFINQAENNLCAFAEFKYYTLNYLRYAKEHYPAVYNGIIGNKKYVEAFKKTENEYAKKINTYLGKIKSAVDLLASKGNKVKLKGSEFYLSNSRSVPIGFRDEYNIVTKEINSGSYDQIIKILCPNTVAPAKLTMSYNYEPQVNTDTTKDNNTDTTKDKNTDTASSVKTTKPGKAKIKNIKTINKGLKVTWGKVSGASGYQIQYSTNKNFKNNVKIYMTNNSVSLKGLKSAKKYYVRIRAYKEENGKKVYGKWSTVKSKKTA